MLDVHCLKANPKVLLCFLHQQIQLRHSCLMLMMCVLGFVRALVIELWSALECGSEDVRVVRPKPTPMDPIDRSCLKVLCVCALVCVRACDVGLWQEPSHVSQWNWPSEYGQQWSVNCALALVTLKPALSVGQLQGYIPTVRPARPWLKCAKNGWNVQINNCDSDLCKGNQLCSTDLLHWHFLWNISLV